MTLHEVSTSQCARKAVEKGADGRIAVASGAGGHADTMSPMALIHEIREWFDGPLLLSGAIGSGDGILAAQAMGADVAYIGSVFIAPDRKNVVLGKSVAVRVDLGGRRIRKKKKHVTNTAYNIQIIHTN